MREKARERGPVAASAHHAAGRQDFEGVSGECYSVGRRVRMMSKASSGVRSPLSRDSGS